MKDNKNIFDQELSARLNTEELPFDPMAWEMMEEKLDDVPQKLPLWILLKRYLTGATAMIVLSSLVYWYWPTHQDNTSNDRLSQLEIIDNIPSTSTKSAKVEPPREIEQERAKLQSTTANKSNKSRYKGTTTVNPTDTDQSTLGSVGNSNMSKAVDTYRAATEVSNDTRTSELKGIEVNNVINSNSSNDNSSQRRRATQGKRAGDIDSPTITRYEVSSGSINTGILDELNALQSLTSSPLAYNREILNHIDLVDVEPHIERPQHQINLSIGAGATQVNIEAPISGSAKPTATSQKEMFLSLSYLYRTKRHLGFELGAQGSVHKNRFASYFEQGEYGLAEPTYAAIDISIADDFRYDIFTNVHYFLPLNQRSELDFYAGYYALNLFNFGQGTWGSGSSRPLDPRVDGTDLIRTETSGNSGPFEGGRIKLGLNYNFLTNKLNNVGIGISYMHEVVKDIDGTYSFFRTSDETRVLGNFRTNGSGLKVQLTYGFGLNKAPWKTQILKKENTGLYNPWYVGVRYGFKQYFFEDDLAKALIGSSSNQSTGTLYVGHFVKKKLALEFGLGYTQLNYSTRTSVPENSGVRSISIFTIPFALRRDLFQSKLVSLYGKAVVSTDFRVGNNDLFLNVNTITDEEKFLFNAGLAAGIDFRLVKGLNIGFVANYNHALRKTAIIQQPVLASGTQNQILLEDINLKNQFVSWGLELKYYINR